MCGSGTWLLSAIKVSSILQVLRYLPGIIAFLPTPRNNRDGKPRGNRLEEALAYILSSSLTSTPSFSSAIHLSYLSRSLSSLSLEGRVFLCKLMRKEGGGNSHEADMSMEIFYRILVPCGCREKRLMHGRACVNISRHCPLSGTPTQHPTHPNPPSYISGPGQIQFDSGLIDGSGGGVEVKANFLKRYSR